MSHTAQKLLALFLLLWLPLSSSSALAASLAMQLQNGNCHEAEIPAQPEMNGHQMMRPHHHGGEDPSGAAATALHLLPQSTELASNVSAVQHDDLAANTETSPACASCAVCHLACTGFVVSPSLAVALVAPTGEIITFQPEIFISHVSAPLLPPPLARA